MFCCENLIRIPIFLKFYTSLLFKKNTDQRKYCLKNVKNDVTFALPSGLRREDMLLWLASKEPKRPRMILLNEGQFNKKHNDVGVLSHFYHEVIPNPDFPGFSDP